ncbi:MAG: hypothetical protein LBP69_03975 [Treponema sp.]|nr:hypothetical protein [Treponema sp.]
MKISRKTLLWITAGLGIALIAYSLVRHFTSFSLDEKIEKYIMDGIIFAALALFMYNRKLASDERKAREAAEQEKLKAEQPEETISEGEEDLPHWERAVNKGETEQESAE